MVAPKLHRHLDGGQCLVAGLVQQHEHACVYHTCRYQPRVAAVLKGLEDASRSCALQYWTAIWRA